MEEKDIRKLVREDIRGWNYIYSKLLKREKMELGPTGLLVWENKSIGFVRVAGRVAGRSLIY